MKEDEMSEELRPCPFCGGKAITATYLDYDDEGYMAFEVNDSESITCENERCINGWYLSPKDWNTRPIEDALNKRIAELETAQRWIPVSERLPEDRVTILAAFNNREILTAKYYKYYEGFGSVENYWRIEGWHSGNVTHWMPLPESPEVQA